MPQTGPNSPNCRLIGRPHATELRPDRPGTLHVRGLIERCEVTSSEVATLRPDLFGQGHFSVFDALVHACNQGGIRIEYHFHEELLTHVVDSIDGQPNWWYAARYHGGRACEEPAHRMDTHPWKDWTVAEVYRVSEERVRRLQSAFRREVRRREANGGKVIVPEVTVRTPHWRRKFTDVNVEPHDLRRDVFQPGELTAADIMLSLAESGRVSLDVQWKDRIGNALVQAYVFTRFDDQEARGRAGFTYELGERTMARERFGGFGDNNFHMTADIRAIVSPQYVEWRWTDLSQR